jgi:hypothetical protein
MTNFEQYQQSIRRHLVVAERAARLLREAAENDEHFLDSVRWEGDPDASSPAGAFDTRRIHISVQHALLELNDLRETRDEEPHRPTE